MVIRKYPLLALVIVVLIGGGVWYRQLFVSIAKPIIVNASSPQPSSPTQTYEDNTFYYPELGIKTPVIRLLDTDPFDSTDWQQFSDALNNGVGVSTVSPTLEDARTLYIIGHSSTVKQTPYSFVFAGLGQSNKDDTFSFTADGKSYTYKVVDKKVLKPTDEAGFMALEATEGSPKRAVLVTCWPVFTTANRLVVIGEQI